MSIPVLLHSHLINNLQRNFTRILRVHIMSDLKRMTCIHHLSLYTMQDGYVLASLLLIASFVFSSIALQLYSLPLFLGLHVPRLLSYNPPGRVWCYGNGNTVPSEGRVQPRSQAPLLLRRHRTLGIMGRNAVETSRDTTQAIKLYSSPSLSFLLSVDCSVNCSLCRPINHCLLLMFAHFLGKI